MLFLPIFIFTNPSLSSHLEAKAWGDGFFNGSWKLFFTRTLPSLLFCVVFPSFFCCKKKLYGLAVGSKKGGKKVMSRHLMSINSYLVTLLFLFFSCFLPFIQIFFIHCTFEMLGQPYKGNGSTSLGIRPISCLVNLFYSLFVNFDLILEVFRSSYSIFLKHDLPFFCYSFHSTSLIAIPKIIHYGGYWGYFSFVQIQIYVAHTYIVHVIFTQELFYVDFIRQDRYFIYLNSCMVILTT